MSIEAVSSYAANSAAQQSATSSSNQTYGMDDFFTLLAAQLQYQDPLEPTDNSQFMSQMAQFSLLEQVQSLAKSLNVSVASSAVGKGAIYNITDSNGNTTQAAGTISAADLSSGTPQYLINGQWVGQSSIVDLYEDSTSSNLINAASLVGKKVTYTVTGTDGKAEDKTGVISSVDLSTLIPKYKIADEWISGSDITGMNA